MPDMNDFYAFNSTSGGDGGGDGCLPWKTIIIIVVVYIILTLLGKCSG